MQVSIILRIISKNSPNLAPRTPDRPDAPPDATPMESLVGGLLLLNHRLLRFLCTLLWLGFALCCVQVYE